VRNDTESSSCILLRAWNGVPPPRDRVLVPTIDDIKVARMAKVGRIWESLLCGDRLRLIRESTMPISCLSSRCRGYVRGTASFAAFGPFYLIRYAGRPTAAAAATPRKRCHRRTMIALTANGEFQFPFRTRVILAGAKECKNTLGRWRVADLDRPRRGISGEDCMQNARCRLATDQQDYYGTRL